MGQKFPVCNAHQVIHILRKHGFQQISQKGSHQKWRHTDWPTNRSVLVRQPSLSDIVPHEHCSRS